MISKSKLLSAGIILGILLLVQSRVFSADNLIFKGNLRIPNCVVNNNNSMEVDFGEVEIQSLERLGTAYYGRDLTIPINCPYNLGTPKLKIETSMALNNNGALRTSKYVTGADEGLLIYFLNRSGGARLQFNSEQDATSLITNVSSTQKNLVFHVALGRNKEMSYLTPGPFTSAANIVMRYE